ncbi:hypothetical protein IKQ19_05450, partial [Candidatus Saccharibacteria bacterium]|nr:hypothetical protein [Candidatus Saccharibacteria bacterium]
VDDTHVKIQRVVNERKALLLYDTGAFGAARGHKQQAYLQEDDLQRLHTLENYKNHAPPTPL